MRKGSIFHAFGASALGNAFLEKSVRGLAGAQEIAGPLGRLRTEHQPEQGRLGAGEGDIGDAERPQGRAVFLALGTCPQRVRQPLEADRRDGDKKSVIVDEMAVGRHRRDAGTTGRLAQAQRARVGTLLQHGERRRDERVTQTAVMIIILLGHTWRHDRDPPCVGW